MEPIENAAIRIRPQNIKPIMLRNCAHLPASRRYTCASAVSISIGGCGIGAGVGCAPGSVVSIDSDISSSKIRTLWHQNQIGYRAIIPDPSNGRLPDASPTP